MPLDRKKAATMMDIDETKFVAKTAEPLAAAKAFELYYAMGSKRSMPPLAKEIDRAPMQLYNWQRKYYWKERILARDFIQTKELRLAATRDVTEMKNAFAERLRNTITTYFRTDSKHGDIMDIPIKNMADLTLAIKNWLLLSGEATDIHSVRIEIVETVINYVVRIIGKYVADPEQLSKLALELQNGLEMMEKEEVKI